MGIGDNISDDALEELRELAGKEEMDDYANALGALLEALGEGIQDSSNQETEGMLFAPDELKIPKGEPDEPEGKIWIVE